MLILTRHPNQIFYIGQNREVTVKVLSVRGKQVRIGIDAPRNIPVHRDDVKSGPKTNQETPRGA